MSIKDKPWYPEYNQMTNDDNFVLAHFIRDYLFQHRLRYMIYFRNAQNTNNKLMKFYYEAKMYRMCRKYGIEIKTSTRIGRGFKMIHPYNITITPYATLGERVTVMKGATIGHIGGTSKRKGSPKIGNSVYIGINSTLLGNITIGDDVLIAPNTFVDVDVPSHSVVIGSPCQIHHKDNATANFIWRDVK